MQLSRHRDLSSMGLREIARELKVANPQTIKYHLNKLQEAGLIDLGDRAYIRIEKDKLGRSHLITIPVMGQVSAGPATQITSNAVSGYIKISSALLRSKNYKDLYALRVIGSSMNRANIEGEPINDGDYAIVDSSKRSPKNGDYIIATVDDLANLKRFHFDALNNQIVLLSESSEDYLPIFVHPEDSNEGLISGTVIQVMHTPMSMG